MDQATSGEVLFDSKDITKLGQDEMAAIRLDEMGFIFQQMYMMKNLTILDNIILPAIQSKKSGESKKEKVLRGEELMRKLGIIEVADNDINEASGGQLQRDAKVAAKCSRVLYIVDGNIKGEYDNSKRDELSEKELERSLNNWLLDLGW